MNFERNYFFHFVFLKENPKIVKHSLERLIKYFLKIYSLKIYLYFPIGFFKHQPFLEQLEKCLEF